MKRIAISAESTIDLSKDLLKQYDIHTVPFTINLGDEVALDGDIDPKHIINYVNKKNILPKTSAVNEYQYTEHFEKLLKEYDAVIHIALSSEISSAFNNAYNVSQNYDNVYVVNSRSLSTGIALQAIYATKLVAAGLEPEEIVRKIELRKAADQTSFILMRLDYLYKGGRCNALSLISATLLKIRLQIVVKNGKMEPAKKYRGDMSTCIIKYVNDTLEQYNTPDLEEVFITSTTATKDQIEAVKEILVKRGFKNIHITNAGATITSHCGENCLGILYMNDGDSNGVYQEN